MKEIKRKKENEPNKPSMSLVASLSSKKLKSNKTLSYQLTQKDVTLSKRYRLQFVSFLSFNSVYSLKELNFKIVYYQKQSKHLEKLKSKISKNMSKN